MTRYAIGILAALTGAALATARPVSAQEGRFGSAGANPDTQAPLAGWTVSPSLLYSANWDDNVLLKQNPDQPLGDFMNALNPRVDARFNGRRTQFSGSYDGAFLFYQDLNTLNSYDQRGSVSASRLLSKHVTWFVTDSVAVAPTTELAQLVGVPFMRTGAHLNDLRTGIDATVSKRTSITATYQFEWVRFDQETAFGTALLGGYSHGGLFGVRHKLSDLTTLTVDYDRQRSVVGGPETLDVQNAAVGFDRRLSDALRVYAAAGMSRLSQALAPAHTGPRYHAGVSHRLMRTGTLDVVYDRSFAPSYGVSGATLSKDFSVRAHLPLWRRVYTQSAFSWRTNSYLQLSNASLRSRWFEGSIGYLAQPWMRIEGFYAGAHQTTIFPGDVIDRNRFGVQVITVKPVRIR
jgi:uncharacterized protein (PEP-CTERM system associated)